jgi:biopolymer transport protein ExbD
MKSLIRRHLTRRARRQASIGTESLNLVPLVDVLTSIVFFGLLTYTGVKALATLTAFDLVTPAAIESGARGATPPSARPLLTLHVDRGGVSVVRVGEDTERRFEGLSDEALRRLNAAVVEYGRGMPADASVSIIPADDLSYTDLVRVLDEVRSAGQPRIALGIRPRA